MLRVVVYLAGMKKRKRKVRLEPIRLSLHVFQEVAAPLLQKLVDYGHVHRVDCSEEQRGFMFMLEERGAVVFDIGDECWYLAHRGANLN